MAKTKEIFKIFFLFLCLVSFINSEIRTLTYDDSKEYTEYKAEKMSKEVTYNLNFKNQIPYYIKVTITPEEGKSTPLLCFSATDPNCDSDREAISRRTDGQTTALYLKRDQFQSQDKELYVKVTCEESNCNYVLRFYGDIALTIDPNTIYSYLVTSGSKEMRFEVKGEVGEGSILTIGLEGSSTIQLNVDDIDNQQTTFPSGRIVTFPLTKFSGDLAKFTVRASTLGEYINLNVHVLTVNLAQDNLLYPNGPVVMGMLDLDRDGYPREECFPISAFASDKFKYTSKYYLTGRIHSKFALFWLADENGVFMEETEQEIKDGLLAHFIDTGGKKRSVCFEPSYEPSVHMKYVAYSISILEPLKIEKFYNFYPPQTVGQFYRRMIPKGGYAVYHAAKIDSSSKRYNYNAYIRKGAAEMYIAKCKTFPYCEYEIDQDSSLLRQKQIGKQAIWDTTVDKSGASGPLDKTKNVMVIYCRDGDNEGKGYCEVDTSIFVQGQEIYLAEGEKFSKYVVKGEKGVINADLKSGVKVQRLTVDIMVHSGDVSFEYLMDKENNLKKGEGIILDYRKYFLSNKIFYSFNLAQILNDGVRIQYNADDNSFFTIQYGTHEINLIQTEENITSGESYIIQVDPSSLGKLKSIHLQNHRYKENQPFLVNFFALNCDFEVQRGEEEISFFDGYAQEILFKDTQGYKANYYDYDIVISRTDLSNYNNKMCMLYVAGYESKDDNYETEIVVGENRNQQIILNEDFKKIRFLYPLADSTKDLAINFNVVDQAVYKLNFYTNTEKKPFKEFTITRSNIYYVAGNEIVSHCPENTLCSFIVEVILDQFLSAVQVTDPMIEVTIRQIRNTPTYLQKSQAKKDFTCGDRMYYLYTDVGKNEIGEVSVNFHRDFGRVWGRIVRKDQTSVDPEANWRGVYRMPSEEWEDSLPFNGYTKKFEVNVEDTQDCIEGCYLLLSIQVSQIGDYVNDYKFYPFTIISRINPNNYAYTDIPKVVIQVEEFIVGNVNVAENERIYQFYEVWLPHDTFRVEFDWQSEVAGLYINVGGTRPTTRNADFKLLPNGKDSILFIERSKILEKARAKKIKIPNPYSIQDLNLVIGIWTDKTDSVETEVFSLRVHEPHNDQRLDIVEVNTDQKVLCSPRMLQDGVNRCLFMITYDTEDVKLDLPLLVHASSVNNSATTYSYADFIESEYYDEYDAVNLMKNIPTDQTAKINTRTSDKDYIYTRLNQGKTDGKKYYLFVNVISDKTDDIMIITSLPMYNVIDPQNYQFYPNPSTEQLLSVSVDKLRLKFFTTSSLIVNIVALEGEADVVWAEDQNNVYTLKGRGDRLTMTSGTTLDEIIITKKKESSSKLSDSDDPGFVFYISYYIRNPEVNFDEVAYGRSIEIGYRKTDLPVYLYSKIGTFFNDMNIAVTFKDSEIDMGGEYTSSPIFVKAALVKENTIYRAKNNPELTPSLDNSLLGTYDIAIRTAQAFISSEVIKSFNVKYEDNPTLYISLEKNDKFPEKNYEKFNIEAQFSKTNGVVVPIKKKFNYGRYNGYYTNYYKLKADKNKEYMIIELAFNSKYLDFSISNAITRYNISEIITKTEKGRGKIFITVKPGDNQYIYLNIFKKDYRVTNSPLLNNYVFKYDNVEKEDDLVNYKILGNNNELTIDEETDGDTTTIQCTFNRIDIDKNKANITYFFKVVYNESHIYQEEYETIALMQSPYYTVYERNPKDINGKITLVAKGELSNWVYLQVIAQIQQDKFLDYVAYKGKKELRPYNPGKKGDDPYGNGSSNVIMIVAIILILLIAGLVVIVFVVQQRNKSLMDQVKHISFQQNAGSINNNPDPDLLLAKNK